MIKKLPLGVSGFADVRRYPGYLYVDKTRFLADLFPMHGLEKRHLFLARPWRFGKTLLVSTLEALFQGRQELFANTWIGQEDHWDWERNQHAVLRLSLALRNIHEVGQLERALGWHVRRQARVHRLPHDPALTPEQQLDDLIQDLAAQSGGQIVVLVDEYDMAITENLGHPEVLGDVLDIMRAFYGALKEQSDCIRYTFITGITRFSRTGLFSEANHLTDLSFHPAVNALLGFTEGEMHGNPDMAQLVACCATHLECYAADLYAAMADHYNGYRFAPGGKPVYNPYSVAGCLFHLSTAESAAAWSLDRLPRFWAVSGTPSVLQHVLRANPAHNVTQTSTDDPRVLEDINFDVRRPPLAGLLYQSGYLTRRPADPDVSEARTEILDFPNREVKEAFTDSLHQWYEEHVAEWLQVEGMGQTGYLAQLRRALREGDAVQLSGNPALRAAQPAAHSASGGRLRGVLPVPAVRAAADPERTGPGRGGYAGRPSRSGRGTGWSHLDSGAESGCQPRGGSETGFSAGLCRPLFRTRSRPVTVYGLQFDIPAHTILASRLGFGTVRCQGATVGTRALSRASGRTGPATRGRPQGVCDGNRAAGGHRVRIVCGLACPGVGASEAGWPNPRREIAKSGIVTGRFFFLLSSDVGLI